MHHKETADVFMLTSSDNEADTNRVNDFDCVKGYYTKPVNKTTIELILES